MGATALGAVASQAITDANPPTNPRQKVLDSGKEWSQSLSPAGKEAVKGYTGTAYANINATLRGIEKQFEPGNYERAISLHESLQSASIPADCTVYRGVSSKALGALRVLPDSILVGKVISDKGFMSTSIDRNTAFSGDTLLVIEAPKGSHGAYVGDISSAGHYESEVLFDAGSKMHIKGVSRDGYGRRVISVALLK